MKKALIALVLLLTVFLVSASAENAEILGHPFPDFTVTDTQGNTFTLSEALKDHEAVLINIWATWCPPCEAEMPMLNEVYAQYGDQVAFIALSYDTGDTAEKIEAYRAAHGIAFPMGRDEGASLYQYLSRQGVPTTVIVDRFGNAVFLRVGSFFDAGEVRRVLEAFLGDAYTESTVLTEIPKDTATAAFSVSRVTSIRVENEDIKPVIFRAEGDPEPQMTYVIYDDTAHLRLEAAASDDPANMICTDYNSMNFYPLSSLLDPQREVFLLDVKMPAADAEKHYNYICLVDGGSEEGRILYGVYLISGDEYIEELENDLLSWGYQVTWEYADSLPAEETAPQACILHITDQDGAPVPGTTVKFCTDTTCVLLQADENGVVSFDGAPDTYHVQLLNVPDGYSFDADFGLTTNAAYGEWAVRIWKK